MVTKSYVDSLAEGIIAQTMAYATDRLEKSEAAMQRGLARQEAQLLQQADQLQTTTSTISVLHADLKAAELRSATTDSENKQVLATLNSQHLQLNDTLATMAALVRAQAQREELREQERVQERLRQDRSDEMLRQSLDQLGRRLTDQFPNQTFGGPGGPPPHPRPT
jgi:chromosome segregation ATPase